MTCSTHDAHVSDTLHAGGRGPALPSLAQAHSLGGTRAGEYILEGTLM